MRRILPALCLIALGALVAAVVAAVPRSGLNRALTDQPQVESQKASGRNITFDVASIKQDTAVPSNDTVHSNIPLSSQGFFSPTGGLLQATNFPLIRYIIFAYKLTPEQVHSVRSQLPKWASTARYDIEARASGNPTKDEFRIMMQALLADRFKLRVHLETRSLPIFALVLEKRGKLGPQLKAHPLGAACSTAPPPGPNSIAKVEGGFPEVCGEELGFALPNSPGQVWMGARDLAMETIAASMNDGDDPFTGIDRPVVDQTGLTGTFDFHIEFVPQSNPNSKLEPDPSGPTFVEALKDQLGLKLRAQTGPVLLMLIDHVEQPSPNP
jgi:uncharacterized protein (TIGR03435 family)